MNVRKWTSLSLYWFLILEFIAGVYAEEAPAPDPRVTISSLPGSSMLEVHFDPSPATEEYQVFRAPALDAVFESTASVTNGLQWNGSPESSDLGFFQIKPVRLSDETLLATTLLYRLGYGPTPDELDRVRNLGADAYIAEQLAGEAIVENLDTVDITPRWQRVTATGLGTAPRIYLYLDGPGDVYVDDIRLVAGSSDDGARPNLLRNGDFETALGTSWNLSPNMVGTARNAEFVHSGTAALHLVTTEAGETQGSSVYQIITPSLNPTQTYTFTYWYLTSAQGTRLTVRLSGSGIVSNHDLSGSANNPATLFAKL